ncbi:MAG: hypothetical protein ACI9Y8_001320 [Candidatus Omnitrophota bacterium]|jgi:hypothetical protein
MRKLIILLALLSMFQGPSLATAASSLPDDLLLQPALITLNNQAGSSGTGFFVHWTDGHLYLVTAKHVFLTMDKATGEYKLRSDKATVLCYPREQHFKDALRFHLDLPKLYREQKLRSHPSRDIIVVRFTQGDSINHPNEAKKRRMIDGVQQAADSGEGTINAFPPNALLPFEQTAVSNDVYIFGYPNSLGIKNVPQIEYEKPLLRKGIVAGKNYQLKTLILDCPSFYGNSGGPVVQVESVSFGVNEFRLIGVVSQFIPFEDGWINLRHGLKNTQLENSGYSVVMPTDNVVELLKSF